MKKIILILTVILCSTLSANAQNLEQRAIAKAEAAAQQCMNELNYPNSWEMVSFATEYQVCDYRFGGNPNIFGYSVQVAVRPRCAPNQYCIQMIQPLATVLVDCSGEVIEVNCGISGF
jgi:hypothetical protein